MSRKEWCEVGKQSFFFVLAVAAMALLFGVLDLLQGKPFAGEKTIIIQGMWLLMFSMFLGLSPFVMDSKQKGMEYLLTLPFSRRRLLWIKFLPRLAAVVFFYIVFAVLYELLGDNAFAGGFTIFSLVYFSLFLISFSLSLVHENFIVQSIWAGIALCGYVVVCLFICAQGFAWKFGMPLSRVGPRIWSQLSYDAPTRLVSIAVFMLLAAPFIVSFFLAFKKFDLKPVRTFNRRQLLIFLPLLLLALAASLGVAWLVQRNSPAWESNHFVLKERRLLQAGFPGKLTLFSKESRRQVDTKNRILWERLLLEQGEKLYLSGLDLQDGSRIIGCLNLADLSWKTVHRISRPYLIANGLLGIRFDGAHFVYLMSLPDRGASPGIYEKPLAKPVIMKLVLVDPDDGRSQTLEFEVPAAGRNNEPWLVGSDERHGRRFWLVALRGHNALRLWADGRSEALGLSVGIPVYAGGLLFTCRGGSLVVIRLLESWSEIAREIPGLFGIGNPYFYSLGDSRTREVYANRGERIVRIDLASFAVEDVGPTRGHLHMVPPGDFYYVEFENWPPQSTDKWQKLYRLKEGRMILLKQFDFNEAGYGHLILNANGVKLIQSRVKDGKVTKATQRFFAFPDLRELRFKGLD